MLTLHSQKSKNTREKIDGQELAVFLCRSFVDESWLSIVHILVVLAVFSPLFACWQELAAHRPHTGCLFSVVRSPARVGCPLSIYWLSFLCCLFAGKSRLSFLCCLFAGKSWLSIVHILVVLAVFAHSPARVGCLFSVGRSLSFLY